MPFPSTKGPPIPNSLSIPSLSLRTMCNGPRKPMSPPPPALPSTVAVVDSSSSIKTFSNSSLLLEFAACNDLSAVKRAVETESASVIISAAAPWYCRSVGSSATAKMGFADRTPLMIAALYGSTDVLHYIIHCNPTVDHINRRSEFDGATALHLAAAGGSSVSLDSVKILINAGADVGAVDSSGRRPGDVIAKQTVKVLEGFLKPAAASAAGSRASSPETPKESTKKEYPPDLTLPDINNGIYGTDEFRMYSFKVRPCSRAYSHDWTECPFVHPGENARRRDPRKYLYSCVSCPEFRKGSCRNGDNCEYAHGVFESWLHPAQYRTRLCKDETGCNRRVCFFAHKHEELRFVNPTAASVNGLVVPSPRSAGVSNLDLAAAALMLSSSPRSPSAAAVSAGMGSPAVWMNQAPTLQLPSSRLKASMSARDLDVDFELLGLEGYRQKLLDEIHSAAAAAASPRASWPSATASRAADYSSLFGSQMVNQSLTQQLLSTYSNNLPSSPTLNSSSSFGLDHSMAKAIMNSRSAAFAKRSHSFIDQGAAARLPVAPATTAMGLSDWGSREGKLEWGMHGEELNKFRKSASFAYRNNQAVSPPRAAACDEPDLSWVHSLVKDGPSNAAPAARGGLGFDQQRKMQYQMNGGADGDFLGADMFSPWGEEQMVA